MIFTDVLASVISVGIAITNNSISHGIMKRNEGQVTRNSLRSLDLPAAYTSDISV